MTFLVDTNVLSEGMKPRPDQEVLDWMRTYEEDIVIDSVILGEVLYGVLKLPHGRKRREMEAWFEVASGELFACLGNPRQPSGGPTCWRNFAEWAGKWRLKIV